MNGARVRVSAFIIYVTLQLLLTLYPSIRFVPFAICDQVEAHCWTVSEYGCYGLTTL